MAHCLLDQVNIYCFYKKQSRNRVEAESGSNAVKVCFDFDVRFFSQKIF